MKTNLPTREEINVHDSLDERSACKSFLGKTIEEIEALLRDGHLDLFGDLMWMGPVAFQFYVPAAIQYLQSLESKGDSDTINWFLGLLEFRFEYDLELLQPIAKELTDVCRFIVEHYNQFVVTPEIYGDLRPRYQKLIQRLSANS
jgi:hypothetical protein